MALLIDVDGLKLVNDTFGRGRGRAVALLGVDVAGPQPAGDVLVRWGGDEFLLLVPPLDTHAGLRHGERLAQATAGGRVDAPWQYLTPSASIGVSPTRDTPLPMEQLDAALYHVKRNRKGRAALVPG
jgi:diguanylate cyclase (GGDEF)-like protein